MIKVNCHTNLDLKPAEHWPTQLPARPMVGDYIKSLQKWGLHQNRQLMLRVVEVTLYEDHLDVELHMSWWQGESIRDFEEWYKNLTSGSK